MAGPVEAPAEPTTVGELPAYEIPVENPPADPPPGDVSAEDGVAARGADETPPVGDPPQGGDPPPADDSGATVPKHQFDELVAKIAGLETQVHDYSQGNEAFKQNQARLQRLIATVAGLDPQAETPVPNERDQAAFKRLIEVAPGLENLLDPKFKDTISRLEQALGDMDATNAATRAYYARYGDNVMEILTTKYAELIFPDSEKTAADLTKAAREYLANSFLMWVDKDAERSKRYEGLDPKLSDEFMVHLETDMFGTLTRNSTAHQERRLTAISRLPVQGGEGAPAGRPTKKLDLLDEDAVMDHAAELAGL